MFNIKVAYNGKRNSYSNSDGDRVAVTAARIVARLATELETERAVVVVTHIKTGRQARYHYCAGKLDKRLSFTRD